MCLLWIINSVPRNEAAAVHISSQKSLIGIPDLITARVEIVGCSDPWKICIRSTIPKPHFVDYIGYVVSSNQIWKIWCFLAMNLFDLFISPHAPQQLDKLRGLYIQQRVGRTVQNFSEDMSARTIG
ncbi:hypothetical protein P3L10_013521 [Capsicum annuum]